MPEALSTTLTRFRPPMTNSLAWCPTWMVVSSLEVLRRGVPSACQPRSETLSAWRLRVELSALMTGLTRLRAKRKPFLTSVVVSGPFWMARLATAGRAVLSSGLRVVVASGWRGWATCA